MTDLQKLKELEKIDYNIGVYIRRHKEVLLGVPGATEESVATIMVNRIKSVVNQVSEERGVNER